MKRKNAFTLIELLAVIVILAIIALIATPIILGIVEDARKDSFMRSVELVINATDIDIFNKEYNNTYTYTINDGNISNLEIGVKNTDGMNGSITYDKNGNDTYAIHNRKYCVIKKEGMEKAEIKDYVEGECTLKEIVMTYANGQRVYFDVDKGTGCTKEEYEASYDSTIGDYTNSLTGYNGLNGSNGQNSCLLFYAFNDEGKDEETINLILDHNTTESAYWASSSVSKATDGPIDALEKLYDSTSSWKGTIIPENYTLSQSETGNYTISYQDDEFKARLITAQEIAKITGADIDEYIAFDESTAGWAKGFYFDEYLKIIDKRYDDSEITSNERNELINEYWSTNKSEYGWLYDRTDIDCEDKGCYNNANIRSGYWTATSTNGVIPAAADMEAAWMVWKDGTLDHLLVIMDDNGIRPVIKVLKSNISPGEAPRELE